MAAMMPLMLLACGEREPRDEVGAVERTAVAIMDTVADGRVLVRNSGGSSWTQESKWHLEEDLRLGGGERPESEFGDIGAIAVDGRGMIYVLETFAQEIRVFDSTGTLTTVIGNKGQGPGEFMMASAITIDGDTLRVTDPHLNRYSKFLKDGTFVASHQRGFTGWIDFGFGQMLSDGSYLDWAPGFPGEEPGTTSDQRIEFWPIRVDRFGQVDSLPAIAFAQEMTADGTRRQPFFNGGVAVDVQPNGYILFAHTRKYKIYQRTLDGDTVRVFTLPAKPAAVDDSDRSYVRRRLGSRPEQLQAYVNELPSSKPIIHRIVSDGGDYIYVIADVANASSSPILDVFRRNGEYVGRLSFPVEVSLNPPPRLLALATAEHIYVVSTDSFDISYVSRLKIVRTDG